MGVWRYYLICWGGDHLKKIDIEPLNDIVKRAGCVVSVYPERLGRN